MDKDIRWEQRLSNFKKALKKLEEAVTMEKELSDLETEGLIQRFEYSYELAWKTLQDLISHKGFEGINGPGAVLFQAYKMGLTNNADAWRRLKRSRELTSHTYDSDTAKEIGEAIRVEYFDLFKFLQKRLEEEKSGSTGNLLI